MLPVMAAKFWKPSWSLFEVIKQSAVNANSAFQLKLESSDGISTFRCSQGQNDDMRIEILSNEGLIKYKRATLLGSDQVQVAV